MQYSSSFLELEGLSAMVATVFGPTTRQRPKADGTVTLTSEEAEVLRLVLDDYILTREQRPVFQLVAAKLRCAPKALPKPR
jgi:hypothetical protein